MKKKHYILMGIGVFLLLSFGLFKIAYQPVEYQPYIEKSGDPKSEASDVKGVSVSTETLAPFNDTPDRLSTPAPTPTTSRQSTVSTPQAQTPPAPQAVAAAPVPKFCSEWAHKAWTSGLESIKLGYEADVLTENARFSRTVSTIKSDYQRRNMAWPGGQMDVDIAAETQRHNLAIQLLESNVASSLANHMAKEPEQC